MIASLRTLIVLLLALPAAAVPQGVSLSWCLCWEGLGLTATTCCAAEVSPTCCSAVETDSACCSTEASADLAQPGDGCSRCHDVEVDPFEPGFERPLTIDLPTPGHLAAGVATTWTVHAVHACRIGTTRAPPGAVRAAGLLPGALPLRR